MKKNKISFLFPLYNEERRINNVKKQLSYLSKKFKNYNFYFLLNNCTDKTETIIKKKLKNYKYKIIKFSTKNRGLGINYCIKNIKSDYFAICAVDNAWNFSFYEQAFKKIISKKKLQIIYGSKSHKNSKINRSLDRTIISFLSKIFLRILFPEKPSHDTQCIKLFCKNISFSKFLLDYNYFSETQFAILAKIFDVSSISLPVNVSKTRSSKVNLLSLLQYISEAIHYRFVLLKFYLKYD